MTDDAKFHEFLEAGGAAILETTNPYEVARFRTAEGVAVVYRNKRGHISCSNRYAEKAYDFFLRGIPWTATEKARRADRKPIEERLLGRDGDSCFYCGAKFCDTMPPTLEHLLSISHGGSNHFSNLCLACEPCNKIAASKSVVEKVKLREKKRDGHFRGGNRVESDDLSSPG